MRRYIFIVLGAIIITAQAQDNEINEGEILWRTQPLGVASSPAISPGGRRIYVTGYAGVFAFRLGDGKLLWKRTVFDNYYDFTAVTERDFEESIPFLEKYNSKKYPYIFATTPAISRDGTRLYAGEVFAHISIGNDGTLYVNSEDYHLWAFNPDGMVKWNNLKFDHWGSDPLIREDGKIIVTSQFKGVARVLCIRDEGHKGVIEWASEPICDSLAFNESNVNIGPDGTIYVHSGVYPPVALFAIQGNSQGLSRISPWPKYMGNIQNNGRISSRDDSEAQPVEKKPSFRPRIHDPSELQYENGFFMTFSTGIGIHSWFRHEEDDTWHPAGILDKPKWWDEVFPDNNGYFWAPCVPAKWVLYYSFEADMDYASAIGRAVATGTAPDLKWQDDGPVLIMGACRDEGTSCPVAIDPSVFKDNVGELYMAFGSGTSGIWIVELDKETGHLTQEAAEGFSENNKAFHRVAYRVHGEPRGSTDYIEAPYVYRHPDTGYYYLFVNWGQCCAGLNSTYQIMVGRSKSPTGPFLDKMGKDMVEQGGTLLLKTEGRYIGPGHAGVYRHTDGRYAISFHYYDGYNEGKAFIEVRDLNWIDGWPHVGKTDFFKIQK